MLKSGFYRSVTFPTCGEQFHESKRGNLTRITTTKFFFPIQSLSFLAIQESLSVWPKFCSSSANVVFSCIPCSPAKPISSACVFRFCPNLGKPTL